MSNEKNELFDFMKTEATNMANEYTRIQKRSTEDPGTAGDQGEENWAKLFRNWLPPIFPVVTKGRILGISGGASPQVDILVLSPAYPHALLDKKLYLAGGVIAAFECKTTLKAQHISKAMECAVKIRKLLPNRSGTPYLELHSSILYGLLAHSHSWKGRSSQPISKISEALYESDRSAIRHPREMVDLVCISDVATWTSVRNTFVGPNQVRDWDNISEIYGKCGSATTAYMCHSDKSSQQVSNFSPIGACLTYLMRRLAWETEVVRPLADYFFQTGLGGYGGGPMRIWDAEIYSEKVRNSVLQGKLKAPLAWEQWAHIFM